MILFPAIDIQHGKCVRLRRGDFEEATVFSTDPVARAKLFVDEGAQALHVVDLDGARLGKMVNLDIIEEIAGTVSIPVEFGGGVRTLEDLILVQKGPIKRVVLGTSAITDQSLLMEAVKLMGDNLVVSVDAERGLVTTHGWQETSRVSATRFAAYLQDAGIKHILYTDIDRDGMMIGMNLDAVRELAHAVNIDIIASGGISNIDDLVRLKELAVPNISSVIVGRALYEGRFTIAEARAVLD